MGPALQELLETAPRLRYFYFRTISRFGLDGNNNGENDQVADYLFQGLIQSSLCRFAYQGHMPTSQTNKHKAILAIQTNPHLRSVETTCEQQDGQLELAICDRDKQWKERWTQEGATTKQKLEVLQEIDNAELKDTVSAFYHYLLEEPSLILPK